MRLAFWRFLFAFLFLFFLLKSPIYACEPTSNPPDILNCYQFTCASTSSTTWAGEVQYTYPDRSTCTQSEWFTDDTCTTNRTNFSCPMSCTSSISSSGCGQGPDCVAGALCTNSTLNADTYCADPTNTAHCNASTLWCNVISCVAPTPTPTPTPLPAPTLSGGFAGGAACSSDGRTLSYNWNSITGAVRYAIRINENGISIVIDNNLPLTPTSYLRSSTPGKSYDAWVHAVDSRGVYSDSSNHSIFTCPAPAATLPPGITPTTPPTQYTCTASNGTAGYCGTASKNFDPSAIPPCSGTDLVVSDGTCPAGSIYSTCYICTTSPGCTSCGTEAKCGGNPPTFPASCPSCSGTWNYQSAGDSTCANASQGTTYPYCWVCSVPLPTATPGPTGAPTPTPTPATLSCTTRTGSCGPGIDLDPNTDGIQGVPYDQRYSCGTACLNSNCNHTQYCYVVNRDESGNPISGTWSTCIGSCPAAPTAPPTSTVSGIVFIDRDADGRKDTDEVGYSGGARLFLNTKTTTTDATGAYQFTSVTSGSYTLELDVPFGFSPNKSTGYSATTGTNKLTFTIPPAVTSADFGIVPYEVGVGGTMYTTLSDTCSAGITSAGRLGSKSLSLSENYFALTFSTATDINGVYSFSAPNQTLFPGSYSITPSDVSGARLICAVVDGTTYETVRSTPYTYGDDSGENLTLTAQNPQKRIDFYYQLVQPWFQGQGADMRIDSGFKDPVSASSRSPYAMLSNGRSPGVIFSGSNSYSFCVVASAGTCLNRASELANPWVVGGTIYPETFTSAITGTARTSYGYLLGLVRQNGQTITEITNSDCYDPNRGCNLAGLDPGVYTNAAGQNNVYTRSSKSQFNRGDYVFLINGNLHIQGELELVNTPNDAVLVVSVSGDITVDKDVGGSPSSSSTHLEGLFSADSDFILESEGTDGDNCPSNRDKRLNIEGVIVANALLTGGTFQNNRTLCDDNSDYPTFYLEESAYLILNAPDFLKHKSFVWQEVAP